MMLMDLTTDGALLVQQSVAPLPAKFIIDTYAIGSGGFGPPSTPLPLVPAATGLTSELYRNTIPVAQTVIEAYLPNKKTRTYSTVGGIEFLSPNVAVEVGEAGIFATVTDPGGSGRSVGDVVFLAQAHFPRVCLSYFERLAFEWPIEYVP
jgi:hypothetical protein